MPSPPLKSDNTDAGAALWERVLQFGGTLSPSAARAFLKLRFSPQDEHRMRQLSAGARASTSLPLEQTEIDAYEHLGSPLDILHSQARRLLGGRKVSPFKVT